MTIENKISQALEKCAIITILLIAAAIIIVDLVILIKGR